MKASVQPLVLVCLTCAFSKAFTTRTTSARQISSRAINDNQRREQVLHFATSCDEEQHPAVVGWPEKYVAEGGSEENKENFRIISEVFEVHPATDSEMKDLDVKNWPTWTTGDKPKWDVGNQVVDKEMPYGELSYMITGKLEIIPKSTGVPVVVSPGDLVTFPKGFVASWQVLEELTWHYYLY